METLISTGGTEFAIHSSENFPITSYSKFFLDVFPDVFNKHVVDFGSGSGILSVFSLLNGAKNVIAIDSAEEALLITQNNLEIHGLSKSAIVTNCENYCNRFGGQLVEIIISNPASLPSDGKLPSFYHGGYLGVEMIIQLIDFASTHLCQSGALYYLQTSLVPFSIIKKNLEDRKLLFDCIRTKEIAFRPFYASILPHLIRLKNEYPEIQFFEKDGNVFETVSLYKVTRLQS